VSTLTSNESDDPLERVKWLLQTQFIRGTGLTDLQAVILEAAMREIERLRGSHETREPQGLWDHEPTPDMVKAGIHVWSRNERASTADDVRAIYIAMRRLEGRSTQKAGDQHG
jgi:hypothetical protein